MLEVTPDQARWLLRFFVGNIVGEHAITMRVVRTCPDDMLPFQPTNAAVAFSGLLSQIYADGLEFLKVAQGHRVTTPSRFADSELVQKSALIRKCSDWHQTIVDGFRSLTDERLVTIVEFNDERFPAVFMADWHVVNMVHYRGMMCSYLQILGTKVPRIYLR